MSKKNLAIACALVIASISSLAGGNFWLACIHLNSLKTHEVGPGYWTDGFGASIGPSWTGNEVVNGPARACLASLLPQVPEDYHTEDNLIIVNIGSPAGTVETLYSLDLFFPPGLCPIQFPIFAAQEESANLQIQAEYFGDPLDPDVFITLNNVLVYAGLLSGFLPADFGLAEGGFWELFEACPGDFDGDGDLDFTDLVTLLQNWGPCEDKTTEGPCVGDLDGDGFVGFNDLVQVLVGWGPCRICPEQG